MNLLKRLLGNFNTEIDIWFFYGFILTFPFSIRKVITFFPIRGQFNEYSGIYLYLSDVFLLLAIFSWLIILCNKYSILSIYTTAIIHKDKLWTRLYPQFSPRHILAYFSLTLILWSFLSILWSDNQIIALFRSLKLLELFLLSIYVALRVILQLKHTDCSTPSQNVPRLPREPEMFHVEHFGVHWGGTFLRDTFKLIIFGGIINSLLAIWQFIIQHSIGLTFLKESLLSADISGVAKIVIFGHKLIRAYGSFPHPNVLGGFLLFSIVLTIYYRQMFHVEHLCNTESNVPRGTFNESATERSNNSPLLKGDVRRTEGFLHFFTIIIIAIQIIALILTFSKSAIIGLTITLIYINVPRGTFNRDYVFGITKWLKILRACPVNLKCSTWNISEFTGVEHLLKLALTTFFALFIVISIFPNLSPIQIQSLEQREMILIVPRGTIANSPIVGIGQGQLVWSMRNNPNLLDWQFQPVHNVFLLIWSELGIVGLILFVWMLWKMFHVEHFKISPFGKGGLGGFEKPLKNHQPSSPSVLRDIPAYRQAGPFSKGREIIFQAILLGFIFIMLFDHYLWDIHQGQLVLWMIMGLTYGASLIKNNKSDRLSL